MFVLLFIQKEMEGQEDERNVPKISSLTDGVATVIKKRILLTGLAKWFSKQSACC